MKLIEKDKNGNYYTTGENIGKAYPKLGQLEDILEGHNIEALEELDGLLWYVKEIKKLEQELNIDLITLFKALNNGIWIKKQGKDKPLLFFYEDISLYKDCLYICPIDIYDEKVSIYQYGKTWALTKEELV